MEQQSEIGKLKTALNFHIKETFEDQGKKVNWKAVDFLFEEAINQLVHKNVLENDRRPDGRKLDELRALDAEVGLFSRTHGSALFRRGNTQALAVTTWPRRARNSLSKRWKRTASAVLCSTTTSRRFRSARSVISAARDGARSAMAIWRASRLSD